MFANLFARYSIVHFGAARVRYARMLTIERQVYAKFSQLFACTVRTYIY